VSTFHAVPLNAAVAAPRAVSFALPRRTSARMSPCHVRLPPRRRKDVAAPVRSSRPYASAQEAAATRTENRKRRVVAGGRQKAAARRKEKGRPARSGSACGRERREAARVPAAPPHPPSSLPYIFCTKSVCVRRRTSQYREQEGSKQEFTPRRIARSRRAPSLRNTSRKAGNGREYRRVLITASQEIR